MHGGKRHLNVVDSIVAKAISPESGVSDGLNAKDAEDISSLYLEVKISLLTQFYVDTVISGHWKNNRLRGKGATCCFLPLHIVISYNMREI